MLKIYFKEKCGRRTEGRLIKTKYPNGNLAIAIDIMEGDRPIAINMLTINLPESSKEENVAFNCSDFNCLLFTEFNSGTYCLYSYPDSFIIIIDE